MTRFHWNLLPPVPEQSGLSKGLPHLLAQLAYNRGIREETELGLFLKLDSKLLNDPFLMPGLPAAISRIYRALLSGETIAVYGDYDVDGITATAILVEGLCGLGARAIPYIPHRINEGYGLSVPALQKLRQQGVSLVITTDCGITSVAEVKKAQRIGLDVIITDHHTPLPELPDALAVINPRLSGIYPFSELAGAGVAFKLLQGLLASMSQSEKADRLLDLAALGTIADMSPLVGENRYLVQKGLDLINESPRIGLREIITRSGIELGAVDAEKVSWVIAPCLNAAGRLGHAMTSYNLLTTGSTEEASRLAVSLLEKNVERQQLTSATFARAREQVVSRGVNALLLASDSGYHAGIAGLVASRLAGEFYRPAVVVSLGERVSSGSCRSIPEFNMVSALSECKELLVRFGGHSQAAGFLIPTRNLGRLERQLSDIAASRLAGLDLRPMIDIDMELRMLELAGDTYQTIQSFVPFGKGNPAPVFLSRGITVVECRTMGNGGDHLRFKFKQGGGAVWDAVAFGFGNCFSQVPGMVDIVYNLEIDRWNGLSRLRLNVLDFASASPIGTSSPAREAPPPV